MKPVNPNTVYTLHSGTNTGYLDIRFPELPRTELRRQRNRIASFIQNRVAGNFFTPTQYNRNGHAIQSLKWESGVIPNYKPFKVRRVIKNGKQVGLEVVDRPFLFWALFCCTCMGNFPVQVRIVA